MSSAPVCPQTAYPRIQHKTINEINRALV